MQLGEQTIGIRTDFGILTLDWGQQLYLGVLATRVSLRMTMEPL